MVLHPSIEEKGMTTMRLHRLHFSSRLWPLTFAMSCPHSQRVSVASDVVLREELVTIYDFVPLLILRTIIKIVRSVVDEALGCQQAFYAFFNSWPSL